MTKSKSSLLYQALPENDPMHRCPDIKQAQQLFQWTPTITLEAGLSRIILYWQENLVGLKKDGGRIVDAFDRMRS